MHAAGFEVVFSSFPRSLSASLCPVMYFLSHG